MKVEYISPSRIRYWNECQVQYKFRYHDEIEIAIEENPYIQFGKFVHLICERAVSEKKNIQNLAKEELLNFNFPSNMISRIPVILRHWQELDNKIPSGAQEEVELEFNVNVENSGVMIKGIIDRIIVSNNNAIVIDYKTTESVGRQKTKRQAYADPQMILYSYAVHKLKGVPFKNIQASLFYVDSGNIISVAITETDALKYANSVINLSQTIKSTKPEKAKPNPGSSCKWCDYKEICGYYARWKQIMKK